MRTRPLARSIRFNTPPAVNPTDRLSGDQNGNRAPSVPASGRASCESSGRSQSRGGSCPAWKTTLRPSGEIASDSGSAAGGVTISRRVSGTSAGAPGAKATIANAAAIATSAIAQPA